VICRIDSQRNLAENFLAKERFKIPNGNVSRKASNAADSLLMMTSSMMTAPTVVVAANEPAAFFGAGADLMTTSSFGVDSALALTGDFIY